MKFIQVLAAVAVLLFYSCNDSENSSSQSEEKEKEKNITSRDLSINPRNAYNDLFMDSAAVEKFITEKQLSDSIGRRVRSFYNARNFEYAWFSSTGLTEQARCFWNQHDYVTTYGNDTTLKDKALQKKMDRLIAEDTLIIGRNDKSYLATELTLTSHFIQ
jgi:hypothetical protein